MKTIKKSLLLILIFILNIMQSCQSKSGQFINVDAIVIPDSLSHFFPKNNTFGLKLYSIGTNAERDLRQGEGQMFLEAYFIETYSCEDDKIFDPLINGYKIEAIDSLKPMDNNYFIIKNEDDILKMYDHKTLKERYRDSIEYILPYFGWNVRELYGDNASFQTICGLPEDYDILIMKSGRDYVLPNNHTWKVDWKILPSELKHGYTSGIAYRSSSDKIIYWCIAW